MRALTFVSTITFIAVSFAGALGPMGLIRAFREWMAEAAEAA